MSKLGFELETVIHKSILAFRVIEPALICRREQEIKEYFSDNTLNGVDHWVEYKNKHIFIQDKWKDTVSQTEMAQFVTCVGRLNARLPQSVSNRLILATRNAPTKNAAALLEEHNVTILNTGDQKMLACMCIIDIANYLGIYNCNPMGMVYGVYAKDPEIITQLEKIKYFIKDNQGLTDVFRKCFNGDYFMRDAFIDRMRYYK